MSKINSVRKLQILYFSMKNKEIKKLKNGEKKWSDIGIYTYYFSIVSKRDIPNPTLDVGFYFWFWSHILFLGDPI